MTTINWKNPVDGDWNKKGSWDLGRVPQAGDDVVIGLSGTYTVSLGPPAVPPKSGIDAVFASLDISDNAATLNISAQKIEGNVTNHGTLIAGQVDLDGNLTNTGTIDFNGPTIIEGSLINTGSITVTDFSLTDGGPPSDLLTSGSLFLLDSNLEFKQPGSLTSLNMNLTLYGARIDADGTNPLASLTTNAGNLFLFLSVLGNGSASFTNSGTLTVLDAPVGSFNYSHDFTNSGAFSFGINGEDRSIMTVDGTLSNSGTMIIGNKESYNVAVNAAHLNNTGTITLGGYQTVQLIDEGDAAPSTLGSTFNLFGESILEFKSGKITAIGDQGALSIDGAAAFVGYTGHYTKNFALQHLASDAGMLTLGGGVVLGNSALAFDNSGIYTAFNHTAVKTNLDFTNTGILDIDTAAAQGGSSLSVGGTLSNSGTVQIGNASLDGTDASAVATLSNTGTLELAGGSTGDLTTLKVAGTATNSGTVDIGDFASLTKANTYTQTAGTTDVDGTINLPDTFVQGGLVDGTGKITSSVVVTGGAIAGGDFSGASVGTLSIHGKLVDSADVDATLIAAGSGAASNIDVSGTKVSLRGGTLNVHIADPANLHAGETFTVLTFTPNVLTFGFSAMTDGTHTGDGNSLDLGNGFTLDAAYDNAGGDITLTVVDTPAHADALMPHHGDVWPISDWV